MRRLAWLLPIAACAGIAIWTLRARGDAGGSGGAGATEPAVDPSRIPSAEIDRAQWPKEVRVHGTVLTRGHAPVAGADVTVPGAPPGRADAQGVFDLPRVPGNRKPVILTVRAAGYAETTREFYLNRPDIEHEIVIAKVAPIFGTVVDGSGEPLSGVGVDVLRNDRTTAATVVTSADGAFRFDEALARRRHVRFAPTKPGLWRGPAELFLESADCPATVRLERVEGAYTLVVRSAEPLREASAVPFSGGLLLGRPEPVPASADGEVRLEGLGAGTWGVFARTVSGGTTLGVAVVPEQGALVLPAGTGTIEARVAFDGLPGGSRPERVTAHLVGAGGLRFGTMRPDDDGRVVFRAVPGQLPVTVRIESAACVATAATAVEPGAKTGIELRAVVPGTLRLASDGPCGVDRFALELAFGGGPWGTEEVYERQHDRVRLGNRYLAPGAWRWRVRYHHPQTGEPRTNEGVVDVREGLTTALTLTFR